MFDRREMIFGATAALTAGTARPGAAQAGPPQVPQRWAPYRDAIAIDGCGGLGRFGGPQDGSWSAVEVEDAVKSGLTGIIATLAPSGQFRFGEGSFETTVKSIALWERNIAAHAGRMLRIDSHADLLRAKREGRVGIVYGFQESSPLGDDLGRVALFHELGVRLIQLTHNKRNLVGDGCMEPGNAGLSQFGLAVVAELNKRRLIVDLAHAGVRTMAEAIAASTAPVLVSHTGCKALADLPRNSTDENLKAMADKGGVAGMVFWPYLTKVHQPMAEDLIRHIEHAVNVCGEDHVGLGTDATVSAVERTPEFERDNREYIGYMVEDQVFEPGRPADLYLFIPDLNHLTRFETLAAMLSKRGHKDGRIEKILGGNFARVMKEVWG